VGELAESLEVSCILVHWDVYDSVEDGKDLVMCIQTIFEFEVFVPERVCKKIQTYTTGAALEEPITNGKSSLERGGGNAKVARSANTGRVVCSN
jgi:hypothetical protein